mgnify:CR=1 FL=1
MGANRYSRLIKNSSEEDLKLYIYIIESELGYRKGEVIDLSNTQKSNLQFKLGELISQIDDLDKIDKSLISELNTRNPWSKYAKKP